MARRMEATPGTVMVTFTGAGDLTTATFLAHLLRTGSVAEAIDDYFGQPTKLASN